MLKMKKKKNFQVCLLTLLGVFILFNNSCKKDVIEPYINANKPLFNPVLTYGTVTDIDSNIYRTISIGTQIWMAENLKVIHYRNGDPITNVIYVYIWDTLTTGAYCEYYNRSENSKTYGNLYNWYSVNDSRIIAPTGWHIPTNDEWDTLQTYLGLPKDAGGKLKETDFLHWQNPNTGATNESGFTALPGGLRNESGNYYFAGNYAHWWSSSINSGHGGAYFWIIYSDQSIFSSGSRDKRNGFSVRCVKDK